MVSSVTEWRRANPEKAEALRKVEREEHARRMRDDPEYRERRNRRINKRYRDRAAAMDALKDGPCADCGHRWPPYVMDWDHRDPSTKRNLTPKGATINMKSWANWRSWEEVLAEIAKCDLVCSNCHRIRTHERRAGGSGRRTKR